MPNLPTADELFEFLDGSVRRLTRPHPGDFGPIGSRGRALAWNWSFWGRALVFAYAATHESRFLDLFVETVANIVDQRDDRLGLVDVAKRRVVPGWGTDINSVRLNEVTVAGLVTLPLCEFLLLVRDDPVATERYGHLSDQYLAIAEEVVWQYETDYRVSRFGGSYVNPMSGAAEPLNHTHALAAAFAHLSVLTTTSRYRSKVDEIAHFFIVSVTREANGSWSWPYVGSPGALSVAAAEQSWKAGTTIEFPAAALRHGLAFRDHFEALSATLMKNILRPDGINTYVTSTRTDLLDERFAGTSLAGASLAVWFLMPDPHGSHRTALLEQMDRQPNLIPRGWLGGARGLAMAAAWLMKAAAQAETRVSRATGDVAWQWR